MKRWQALFSLVMVVVVGVCNAHVPHAQEAFLRANRLYEQAEFEQALALYAQVQPQGATLLINRGAALYALGRYPEAITAWMGAQADATPAQLIMIQAYLQKVRTKLGLEAEEHPWWNTARHILAYVSRCVLQLLFFVCWTVLLLRGCWLCRRRRWVLFSLLSLITLMVSLATGMLWFLDRQRLMVVTQPRVVLRAGNGHEFHALMPLAAGRSLTVIERNGEWLKVKVCGTCGWVQQKDGEMVHAPGAPGT